MHLQGLPPSQRNQDPTSANPLSSGFAEHLGFLPLAAAAGPCTCMRLWLSRCPQPHGRWLHTGDTSQWMSFSPDHCSFWAEELPRDTGAQGVRNQVRQLCPQQGSTWWHLCFDLPWSEQRAGIPGHTRAGGAEKSIFASFFSISLCRAYRLSRISVREIG